MRWGKLAADGLGLWAVVLVAGACASSHRAPDDAVRLPPGCSDGPCAPLAGSPVTAGEPAPPMAGAGGVPMAGAGGVPMAGVGGVPRDDVEYGPPTAPDLVEVWTVPFRHHDGTFDVWTALDLAVGADGDLWLLGEHTPPPEVRLWLERVAPDGTLRWGRTWQGEHAVVKFGVDKPEPNPSGCLVVDAEGRATVAGTLEFGGGAGEPSVTWVSQVAPDGTTAWTLVDDVRFLAGLSVDDVGRVYAALGTIDEDPATGSRLSLSRVRPDGTAGGVLPLATGTLTAPVHLVVAPGEDPEALFAAGASRQIFGTDHEAFVGRFALDDGASVWPPAPPATGPTDYSSAVAAVSDGAGGTYVAVATSLPGFGADGLSLLGPGRREVRRIDANGDLLWSTTMRNADGSERRGSFGDWALELAVDAVDGSVYVAFGESGTSLPLMPVPFDPESRHVIVDKLRPDGSFGWQYPFVLSEGGHTPVGLAVGLDGALYLLRAQAWPTEGAFNLLTRFDPSELQRGAR